jgi:hypothetical protein
VTRAIWELLDHSLKICPSCGSSWYPTVDNPKSCPLCKSYALTKNRQPLPDEFEEVNFFQSDFEIRDRDWKTKQDRNDLEIKLQKKAVFEKIHFKWKKEFDEREKEIRNTKIITMFKEKVPIWKIARESGITELAVKELLVAQGAAQWVNKPKPSPR